MMRAAMISSTAIHLRIIWTTFRVTPLLCTMSAASSTLPRSNLRLDPYNERTGVDYWLFAAKAISNRKDCVRGRRQSLRTLLSRRRCWIACRRNEGATRETTISPNHQELIVVQQLRSVVVAVIRLRIGA